MSEILAKAEMDLERAQSRAARLRDDLAKAESDVLQMSGVVSWLRKQMGLPEHDGGITLRTVRVHSTRSGISTGSKSGELVNAAIEAITKAGRPLSIAELEFQVNAAGHAIGGANPRANLAGYMSRDRRVQFTQGVGWTLAGPENEEGSENSEPQSFTGDVAERSNASDSKSEEPPKLPGDRGSVGSNPTVSAPIPTRHKDFLGSTSLGTQPPNLLKWQR